MKGGLVYAAIGKSSCMLSETFQHGCYRVFSHASARKLSSMVFKSNELIGFSRVSFDGTVLWFILRTLGEGQKFCPFHCPSRERVLYPFSGCCLINKDGSQLKKQRSMICRSYISEINLIIPKIYVMKIELSS